MTPDHRFDAGNGLLELLGPVLRVPADLDLDKDCEAQTDAAPIKDGSVAADRPVLLQPLESTQAGRRRQMDALGKEGIWQPPVGLEVAKNRSICGVDWQIIAEIAPGET
jgi:hypothetical protein